MNFKIQKGDSDQIPQLKKIWSECFGDSDEYIDLFFEKRFKTTQTITATVGDKTVGAVYLLPVTVNEYGLLKKGWYGYAIGVLEKYRKNGIYAAIHAKICEYIKTHNQFYILCPANHKLYEYYCGLGFSDYAYLSEITLFPNGSNTDFTIHGISPTEYMRERNLYFNEDGIIYWDENAIEYALCENDFCGGFCAYLQEKNNKYIVLARPHEGSLKISESTVPKCHMQSVTSYMCRKYQVNSVTWERAAYDFPKADNTYISAIGINIKKPEYPYMNLVLD